MQKTKKIIAYLNIIAFVIITLVHFYLEVFSKKISVNTTGKLFVVAIQVTLLIFSYVFFRKDLDEASRKQNLRYIVIITFGIYLFNLFVLLFIDSMYGRNNQGWIWSNLDKLDIVAENSVNLIPFKGIGKIVSGVLNNNVSIKVFVTNILGNIFAFMPFAIFLKLISDRCDSIKRFILTMLIIILSVEILQLVTLRGVCDIDDLILNLSGALLLFLILKIGIINKNIQKIRQ